ncbi:unnamed protein product [Heligmosomoides polygyrus]|uniref:Clr5 domain-containing protein n=1 Tax=Heligmosomoides polygyrus TaxID=6339 RepID=A0A183GNX8_HELPZ|nr:unnamed protein product [Heligmosomoides polygyrus]
MSDGNADWVAQNLHRQVKSDYRRLVFHSTPDFQRKILEEKQRQKRIASANIRSNHVPTAGYHTMNPSGGFGFAAPPCYDGPLSACDDPDSTGPTLVTIRGFDSTQSTVSRPASTSKELLR